MLTLLQILSLLLVLSFAAPFLPDRFVAVGYDTEDHQPLTFSYDKYLDGIGRARLDSSVKGIVPVTMYFAHFGSNALVQQVVESYGRLTCTYTYANVPLTESFFDQFTLQSQKVLDNRLCNVYVCLECKSSTFLDMVYIDANNGELVAVGFYHRENLGVHDDIITAIFTSVTVIEDWDDVRDLRKPHHVLCIRS
ncbi:hypothetical protein RCL1_008448 [Eukaryota sp. TZLM3-RCL]